MFANGCSKTNNPFQAYVCRFLLRPGGREERGKLIFNNNRFLFACRHQKRQKNRVYSAEQFPLECINCENVITGIAITEQVY